MKIYHSKGEYETFRESGAREKYYEEKIKILEKQVRTLKRNLREISEVVKEQYDNMPFHNSFTFEKDSDLNRIYYIATDGKSLFRRRSNQNEI
nr:MAG TPA: protein of unknown function (DUF5320) [Caudoviricetes sp.]